MKLTTATNRGGVGKGDRGMTCPKCKSDNLWRDEVDIGVGTQYGPWRCDDCGWYECHEPDARIDWERVTADLHAPELGGES